MKETVEAVADAPVQQRTIEQIAGEPQFMEETVEAESLIPREGVQQRINEQIVEMSLPKNSVMWRTWCRRACL